MTMEFKLSDEFSLWAQADGTLTVEFDVDGGGPDTSLRPVSWADATIDAAKTHALIDWLTTHFGPPWIAVTDRLPRDGQTVDAWSGHGAWKGATYFRGNFTAGNEYVIINGVTHWMGQRKMEAPR